MRPDRLGEALIVRAARAADDPVVWLELVLNVTSDQQLARTLDILTRLAPEKDIAAVAAQVLLRCYAALVPRAIALTRGTQDRPGRALLLDALCRAQVALLTPERVAAASPALHADLSRFGDDLVQGAMDHGRPEAQAIAEQVLAVDERRVELEPGNTTYRRDVSISYNKLADLALAAGRSGDAETLYRQALQVREDLTELEPGNTTYRRDVSISYERLADLALRGGDDAEALQLLGRAAASRRELARREPLRIDLAEELGVTIYLRGAAEAAPQAAAGEIIDLLDRFEAAGTITRKGVGLLGWARSLDPRETRAPEQ